MFALLLYEISDTNFRRTKPNYEIKVKFYKINNKNKRSVTNNYN